MKKLQDMSLEEISALTSEDIANEIRRLRKKLGIGTHPDRDQYLSTVKPVEVMRWVEVKDGLPDKEGYYVTVNEWVGGGPIVPYDRSDTYFKDGVFFAGKDWVVLEWLLEPTLATDKK